jgi:hypothetical protein
MLRQCLCLAVVAVSFATATLAVAQDANEFPTPPMNPKEQLQFISGQVEYLYAGPDSLYFRLTKMPENWGWFSVPSSASGGPHRDLVRQSAENGWIVGVRYSKETGVYDVSARVLKTRRSGLGADINPADRRYLEYATALVKKHDLNGDGGLDADEIKGVARIRPDTDQNKDGLVTAEELARTLTRRPRQSAPH